MTWQEPKIEKGVPIPPRGGKWVRTLDRMKVGDSFTIQAENERNNIYMTAKYHGMSVLTRKLLNADGWRVWLVDRKRNGAHNGVKNK